MTGENGSHVTWRELNLLRETINSRTSTLERRFDVLEAKIDRVLEEPKVRWRAWGPPIAAVIAATLISFFH